MFVCSDWRLCWTLAWPGGCSGSGSCCQISYCSLHQIVWRPQIAQIYWLCWFLHRFKADSNNNNTDRVDRHRRCLRKRNLQPNIWQKNQKFTSCLFDWAHSTLVSYLTNWFSSQIGSVVKDLELSSETIISRLKIGTRCNMMVGTSQRFELLDYYFVEHRHQQRVEEVWAS